MKIFVSKSVTVVKKALLFIPLCLVALGPCQEAFSENTSNAPNIIKSIEYKYCGPELNISQDIIESHVLLKEGKEFSPFLADASLKSLYASGKFEHVSIKVDEIKGTNDYKVIFSLTPKMQVASIDFLGNKKFKSKVLLKKISTKSGAGLSKGVLKSDAEALIKLYNDNGYPYANVFYDVINENDATEVKVVFNIVEGQKFRIGKIKFIGNDVVKESELLKAMRTKRWTLLSIFKKTGLYHPGDFSSDLETIKSIFRNHGYLDIEIDEGSIIYENRKNSLRISIPVHTGQLYHVGTIAISGNDLYETKEIEDILAIRTSNVFSPAEIDAACSRVIDFYGQSGYINTNIHVDKKADLTSNRIDVEFVINESEKCFVNEVEIHGNSKTKNKVILRELMLAPGDPFDILRMKNSRSRLMNTGYFSSVDVSPINTEVPERKNIRVDVKEANTGKISLGGGISTGGEVVGVVEFSQRNFDINSQNKQFQGGGQKFRSRLQIGKHTLAADINFEEPWWYDRELTVGTNLFCHKTSYDQKLQDYSGADYNQDRIGGEVYLRKRIFDLWEGKLAYSLESVKIYNISKGAPKAFFDREGHTTISKATFSLERDTRNNFMYPTTGSRVGITTELAGGPFLGPTKYVKVYTYGMKHWLVWDTAQQVFSIIGQAGTITPYGGDTTPFFDRFYLGGANFMKGFKCHDVGPRENGTGIGGNTFAYGSLEYCFKIMEPVRFYLFAEAGFVNQKEWNFSAKNYNTDIGFGLKIFIMGVPLRLDFGFPIHGEKDNKHGMRFNYSFGTVF
ncbi:MAG: outer membrane protein assembly factor BamA [Puniceicoccales bacterium]|jgi:outer membrane protein insertion porin family|nr:outer membrane protein assembly factor BamA [Puniceicoccales bacterium]